MAVPTPSTMAETTYNVVQGPCSAWGYRAWVMVGVDLGICGINQWDDPPYTPNPTPGSLAAWVGAGSLHPGGGSTS